MLYIEDNMNIPADILQYLLKVFSMFKMRIWYNKYTVHKNIQDVLGIMCANCDKIIGCSSDNKPMEDSITYFVTNMVFQHVGLSWIIK